MKPGVSVFGYVHAESGVGEHTRLLVETIRSAGIDYSVTPFTTTLSRQQRSFLDLGSTTAKFDTNIIGVNADQVSVFVETVGETQLAGRYNVGLWAWEIEEFPDWMARQAVYFDEIWANSSFSAKAIARKVDVPVHPFPLPIRTPLPRPRTRYDFGLPESFLFLFCFDLDSVFERKNPLAVVDAFTEAFDEMTGPHLLMKSINGDRHPDRVRLLENVVADRRDITYRDGYETAEDQDALMQACDAYVSLHRAEGFGLTMAEAMALGKPVIATGYSGNLDFMNAGNSFLVPFEDVLIGGGCDPYPHAAKWAEPDVDAAAAMMREVLESPEIVAEKRARACQEIRESHSPAARAAFVTERLSKVWARAD